MSSWSGTKKTSCLSLSRIARWPIGWWSGPTKKGCVLSMWSSPLLKTRVRSRTWWKRLSSTARDVMSMWWGWLTLGNRPSSMRLSKKSLGIRISSRLLASQERHWTRSKFHWTMDHTSTIHQGLSIATRWLITWQQKISSMSALKRKSSLRLISSIQSKPSSWVVWDALTLLREKSKVSPPSLITNSSFTELS